MKTDMRDTPMPAGAVAQPSSGQYNSLMVSYDDMTPAERDRFIYLVLRENDLKAIVLIMKKRFGPDVSTDQVMRFAFKVAVGRMTPAHLKKKRTRRTTPRPSA